MTRDLPDVILYCFGCGDVDYHYSRFGSALEKEYPRDHSDLCDGSVMIEALIPADLDPDDYGDPRFDQERTWPCNTEPCWTAQK